MLSPWAAISQHLCCFCCALKATIDRELQVWEIALQGGDPVVAQRRHRAVLRRAEAVQQALARVHDEVAHGRTCGHHIHEAVQRWVVIHIVNAEAALDSDWRAIQAFLQRLQKNTLQLSELCEHAAFGPSARNVPQMSGTCGP